MVVGGMRDADAAAGEIYICIFACIYTYIRPHSISISDFTLASCENL